MKNLILIICLFASIASNAQLYIGAELAPSFNKNFGLNKSTGNINVEYAIQDSLNQASLSFIMSVAIDRVKVGAIFGKNIQFSCNYSHGVGYNPHNYIELGLRYKLNLKNKDLITIGSYIEFNLLPETTFYYIPIAIGYKKRLY